MRPLYLLVLLFLPLSLVAQVSHVSETEDGFTFIFDSQSLGDKYLKVENSYTDENHYSTQSTIYIYQRSTDELLQTLDSVYTMDPQRIGIGDFNFDGYPDFSMFEAFYTGPNTTNLYFLYNPETDRFFLSDFEGTSLEFDGEKELIYMHNSCCGGKYYNEASYQVVDNQMVLVNETCYELDDASIGNEDGLEYKEIDCGE